MKHRAGNDDTPCYVVSDLEVLDAEGYLFACVGALRGGGELVISLRLLCKTKEIRVRTLQNSSGL